MIQKVNAVNFKANKPKMDKVVPSPLNAKAKPAVHQDTFVKTCKK